ncbi:MAG TPA: hypothetical protein VMV98_05680, partial [Acidobacteriaceae bacterium]|nr:hypothetical protein [Acidobacteriaceae bacterium]
MAANDGGFSPASSLTKYRLGRAVGGAVRFLGMMVGQRSCAERCGYSFVLSLLSFSRMNVSIS